MADANEFTAAARRVLDRTFRGIYHLPNYDRIDWSDPNVVEVNIGRDLSTFDFDELTRLVIAAHDECVRAELSACNMQYMKLRLTRRGVREGEFWHRHPTIERAIEAYRGNGNKPAPEVVLSGVQETQR